MSLCRASEDMTILVVGFLADFQQFVQAVHEKPRESSGEESNVLAVASDIQPSEVLQDLSKPLWRNQVLSQKDEK
jgi:hypothetical protein